MQKSTFFFIFILSLGCSLSDTNEKVEQPSQQTLKNNITDVESFNVKAHIGEPFGMLFNVEKVDEEQFVLVANLELKEDTYVISPYSKDSIYGHFSITLEDIEGITTQSSLIEYPKSVEEYDPIIKMPVNFVRQNTVYQQTINLTQKADFATKGLVEFVLEPSCIPYEIVFELKYEAGNMSVQKTDTRISSLYKL